MYQKMLLSEKVAESIIQAIHSGFYKMGDQMPNEMQLAEELKVSRATLREAIKILVSQNILEVRRGIGTFVSQSPGFSTKNRSFEMMNLQTQSHEILELLWMLDRDELLSFEHLNQPMKQKLLEGLMVETSNWKLQLDALFSMVESIALYKQSTFKHQLICMTHEAFKQILSNDPNLIWTEDFIQLVEALKKNESIDQYPDLLKKLLLS